MEKTQTIQAQVTDNLEEIPVKVTHKKIKHKLGVEWVDAYVFKPGDEVVAWRYNGSSVTGVVESWNRYSIDQWGGTVITSSGKEFFPSNITCLRPLTKLEKALK